MGVFCLVPLTIFSLIQTCFRFCFKCKQNTKSEQEKSSSELENGAAGCCSGEPLQFSQELFISCAIRGTNFWESIKVATRLIPSEPKSKLKMVGLLLFLLKLILVLLIIIIIDKIPMVNLEVYDVFTSVISIDVMIELTQVCLTICTTLVMFFCKFGFY